jgi:5'-nucleotidase
MQNRPLVLLTNDDGIDSPLLNQLGAALEERVGCELLVMAPERQRSAMSQTITLHKPLRVRKRGPGRFAVSGTPVDCVYVAVMKMASRPLSLVISGPNDGYNLGTDVFYSGTVGAALEGGLRGVPSIAVSVGREERPGTREAIDLVCGLAQGSLERPLPQGTVLNVNVPAGSGGKTRWTRLGKRFYEDDVHERQDPRGSSYYWIGGGVAGIREIPGSDCEAVYGGVISITPLHLDLTKEALIGQGRPDWRVEGFDFE